MSEQNSQNSDLMRWFDSSHLSDPALKALFDPFRQAAETVNKIPNNAEVRTALRRLIEAKDCAVRGHIQAKESK